MKKGLALLFMLGVSSITLEAMEATLPEMLLRQESEQAAEYVARGSVPAEMLAKHEAEQAALKLKLAQPEVVASKLQVTKPVAAEAGDIAAEGKTVAKKAVPKPAESDRLAALRERYTSGRDILSEAEESGVAESQAKGEKVDLGDVKEADVAVAEKPKLSAREARIQKMELMKQEAEELRLANEQITKDIAANQDKLASLRAELGAAEPGSKEAKELEVQIDRLKETQTKLMAKRATKTLDRIPVTAVVKSGVKSVGNATAKAIGAAAAVALIIEEINPLLRLLHGESGESGEPPTIIVQNVLPGETEGATTGTTSDGEKPQGSSTTKTTTTSTTKKPKKKKTAKKHVVTKKQKIEMDRQQIKKLQDEIRRLQDTGTVMAD